MADKIDEDRLPYELEREHERIQDLREKEQSLMERQLSSGTTSFGNPFLGNTLGAIFVVALVSILVLFFFGFAVIPYARSDVALADRAFLNTNCTACMMQKGDKGDKGDQGVPGKDGKDGLEGTPGRDGRDAICVPNPMFPCAKGDKGDPGKDGKDGTNGVNGIDGKDGTNGLQGPPGRDGINGTNGRDGVNGTDGKEGPPFNGSATFTDVTINGPTTCLVPIGTSCLGPGGCFNFSLCHIVMEGGSVQGVTQAPRFNVGAANSTFAASFQVGSIGSTAHTAIFGRRFGVTPPNYRIALLEVWSTTVLIQASHFLTLRSAQSLDLIAETGTVTIASSAGRTQITAANDLILTSGGLTNTLALLGSNTINVTSPIVRIQAPTVEMFNGATKWFSTNTARSTTCTAPPITQDLTRQSNSMGVDLVMQTYPSPGTAAARIMSNSSDGFLTVGPNVQICGDTFRSSSTLLILQNDTAKHIHLNALTLSNSLASMPVTFVDGEGVDFKGTHIFNSATANHTLDCGITGAVIIDDTVLIRGNLYVTGTVTPSVACPSDRRFKRDIQHAPLERAYDRIMGVPIKQWRYTDTYQRSNPTVKNTTYFGVVAQDVAKSFHYLVDIVKEYRMGNTTMKDAHFVRPELLYGELVGAFQHMGAIHNRLKERIHTLEERLEHALSSSSKRVRKIGARVKRLWKRGKQRERDLVDQILKTGKEGAHIAQETLLNVVSVLHNRLVHLEEHLHTRTQ